MKRLLILSAFFLAAVLLYPSHPDAQSKIEDDDSCSMIAEGQLSNGDRFSGVVSALQGGRVEGEWLHRTPKGDSFFISKMDWVMTPVLNRQGSARYGGTGFAKFGGSGTWNNIEGYTFRVHAREQGGSSGRAYYSISIFGPDGEVFYDSKGYILEGDIQHEGLDCPSPE